MDIAALILVIIGAINWLLIGLFQFDLVAAICGGQTAVLSRIIYSLVGIAGLWCLSLFPGTFPRETTIKNARVSRASYFWRLFSA